MPPAGQSTGAFAAGDAFRSHSSAFSFVFGAIDLIDQTRRRLPALT
jgi:hypothetical protein